MGRDEGGIRRAKRRKEEEMLGNYKPLNFRSTIKKIPQLIKKPVSAREVMDNMDLSRACYVN